MIQHYCSFFFPCVCVYSCLFIQFTNTWFVSVCMFSFFVMLATLDLIKVLGFACFVMQITVSLDRTRCMFSVGGCVRSNSAFRISRFHNLLYVFLDLFLLFFLFLFYSILLHNSIVTIEHFVSIWLFIDHDSFFFCFFSLIFYIWKKQKLNGEIF